MKDSVKLIVKGFIIGLGKIIPGVSGAVFAMMLRVYEPMLAAISNIKKDFFENMKFLAVLGLGIILAIILGSKVILFCLNIYPVQTIYLFIGMMISGIISVIKDSKGGTKKDKIMAIMVILIFSLITEFIKNINITVSNLKINNTFIYFISGLLDALSSIIPGISGTAILMMIGTYETIIKSLATITTFSCFVKNLYILIPFFSGILIGVYSLSKIITYFLKKHRMKANYCIIGFSIFSVVTLFKDICNSDYSLGTFIYSCIFMLLGYFVSNKMNI